MTKREDANNATTAAAAALIKATAEATATALNIQYIQKDIVEIKQAIKDIGARDDSYVLKDEFIFWRNLLVTGLLLTIFIGVVMNLIK